MPDEAPDLQDQPTDEAVAPSPEDQATAPETNSDIFSDSFDPASLPDELRPMYNQYRADYSRKTQEIGSRNREQILQSALTDPDFQRQAAEAWGLTEDDDDYGEPDPDEDIRRELAELKQWREESTQAQTRQQQEATVNQHIDSQLSSLESRIGRELTPKESNFLGNASFNYRDGDGMPDVQAAYDELSEILADNRKSYAQGKRRATRAPSGQSGSQKVNLNNDQERLAAMAEAAEAAMSDE